MAYLKQYVNIYHNITKLRRYYINKEEKKKFQNFVFRDHNSWVN